MGPMCSCSYNNQLAQQGPIRRWTLTMFDLKDPFTVLGLFYVFVIVVAVIESFI